MELWPFGCFFLVWCLICYFMIYFVHGKPVQYKGNEALDGKTAIITGGSSGIGFQVALDLARRGAKVIIGSRDKVRGETAVNFIKEESKNANVCWVYLDLANLLSVREFAQHVLDTEDRLHILVNNAGVCYVDMKDYRTKDGYDTVFLTNYLGHFLLTYLLLHLLQRSAPARIINVSSASHTFLNQGLLFTIRDEKKYGEVFFPELRGYDASKLAMVLHVKELARRFSGVGVTSYSVHPGVVIDSGIWLNMEKFWPWFLAVPVRAFLRPVTCSTNGAAQTVIYCAVNKQLEGISGKYYVKCAEAKESEAAKDVRQSRKLWHASMLLAGCVGEGRMVSLRYLDQQMLADRQDTSFYTMYNQTKQPEEKLFPMSRQ